MPGARSILLAALLALALGAWFLWREGGAADGRGAAPPAPGADAADAPRAAELAPPATEPWEAADGARTALASDASGAPNATSPSATGTVEIRDPSDAPLAEAEWIVFQGDEILAQGITGEDGLARFGRRAGAGEVAVLPRGRFLQRFALNLDAERQVVALAAGFAVAGTIQVDGLPPEERLRLTLDGWDDPGPLETLPQAVSDAFDRDVHLLQTRTAADGTFRFDGLPEDWSGDLRWQAELFLVRSSEQAEEEGSSSRQALELAGRAEDLRIELTAGARLTGQVIDPSTGKGTYAMVHAEFFGGGPLDTRWGSADRMGRFSFSFRGSLPERVELRVSSSEGAGTRTAVFDIPPGAPSYDVGVIELLATRTVQFAVRDEAGQPIEGAAVSAVPEDGTASSGVEGRGSLAVSLGAHALRVVASGFEPVEVSLPPDDEEVVVVLRPGTVLEVRIQPELTVALTGTEPPFLVKGAPSWKLEDWRGRVISTFDGGQGTVQLSGPSDGVYVVSGVRPGIPLALRALDDFGHVAVEAAVPPLAPGERRVVELTASSIARALAGRVVTRAGEPVADAQVSVGPQNAIRHSTKRTDRDGRFKIEGIHAASVCLVVEAPHHAALVIESQPVTDEELELVLDPGRTVRVTVVAPGGEPLTEGRVGARSGERTVTSTGRQAAPGVFDLEGVPAADCTLWVFAGGERFTRPLPPGATDARVEVPAWRACTVRVERWDEDPRADSYVALRSLDADPERRLHLLRSAATDEEARFDVVFPGRYEAFVARMAEPGYAEERLCEAVGLDVPPGGGAALVVTLALDAP